MLMTSPNLIPYYEISYAIVCETLPGMGGELQSAKNCYLPFTGNCCAYIEVLDYITYYNAYRLHSTLGYKTPFGYEKELFHNVA